MAFSIKTLSNCSIEQLDKLYFEKYGRKAYHMSREGYIYYLTRRLPELKWN
jgi:hypothetical protein